MSSTFQPRRFALLDTSAYVALASSSAARHADAHAIAARLRAERWRLFTTDDVLIETHARLLLRGNRTAVAHFLDQMVQCPTTVVRTTRADERRARAMLVQHKDARLSLTAAISLAIMDRLRIRYIFTFDRTFAQHGVTLLHPSDP